MLTFFAARSSTRLAVQERAAVVTQSLENLHAAVTRVEGTVERVEAGVADVRARMARLEGAQAAHPLSGA
jgi:hypothetical protein